MRARALFSVSLLTLAAGVTHAQTTGTKCYAPNKSDTREVDVKLPSGEYNYFIGGGVVLNCPAKKIHLVADSMEQYGDEKRIYLVGHVYYEEPTYNVHSDFLTYFQAQERVVAVGNVNAKMSDGSTLRGPTATYLRPLLPTRPKKQLTADQRPTITIVQHDSSGKATPPMHVTSAHIFMDGDSLVYAGGDVVMVREDFQAHGDSMFLDGTKETMHIMRNPRIDGLKGRPFTLTGILIDLYSKDRKLRKVVSKGNAVAVSQDLTLKSDTIDLRINNDVLERAMAWGPHRASAKSQVESLLSDSMDVIMPGQHVREIRAVRKARAEAQPDTVKFRAVKGEMDWMSGHVIIAYFDTLPPKDTTRGPRMRQLVGIDSAAAFYHLAPSDTACREPAINYTTGKLITVDFDSSGVSGVKATEMGTSNGMAEPCSAKDSSKKAPPPKGRGGRGGRGGPPSPQDPPTLLSPDVMPDIPRRL